ncbi:hypothetical protein C8R47DRAFT_995901, partial [Mycena vitilis]
MTVPCQKCGHRAVDASSPSTTHSGSPQLSSQLHPAQLRADLEAVNVEILRHQTILSELDARRQTLKRDLDQIIYPVLALPPEIISRIFVLCLPIHGRVRPSPRSPPLLLTQVCRDWREIALATCELWCSVDVASTKVGYGYELELPIDSSLALIETWFARAKAQPLSLAIRPVHLYISLPLLPF